MNEQSKAAKRRFFDGTFHSRYFVGHGIDIGSGTDPLVEYATVFGQIKSVRAWDIDDGDAQKMEGVSNAAFNFLHSSHCLEHMNDVREALFNWIRIVKPGGFLIVTVPDEDLYEYGQWPSRHNPDHKWSFTIHKTQSTLPRSINVTDLIADFSNLVEAERVVLVRDFFNDSLVGAVDQTLTQVAECSIEFVLRRRQNSANKGIRRLSAQTVFDNMNLVRDAEIQGLASDISHSVVVPFASYSPWRTDIAFLQAYDAAKPHTLIDLYRAYELWQLVGQVRRVKGDVLEVGIGRGGSALVLGKAMQRFKVTGRLLLAGKFSGVIKAEERDTGYGDGERSDTSVEIVLDLLSGQHISNADVIQEIFPEDSSALLGKCSLKLCHIDVDVHQSARDAFDWIWPRLVSGGIVVFDAYGFIRCEGMTRLVNELAERSDLTFIHNLNGHALFVKCAERDQTDFPSTS